MTPWSKYWWCAIFHQRHRQRVSAYRNRGLLKFHDVLCVRCGTRDVISTPRERGRNERPTTPRPATPPGAQRGA